MKTLSQGEITFIIYFPLYLKKGKGAAAGWKRNKSKIKILRFLKIRISSNFTHLRMKIIL